MRSLLLAVSAVPILLLAACTTNPATGQSQFNMITPEQEVALGIESSPQVVQQYGGALKNAGVQQYTAEVGRKLAALTEAENPKLPWEFTMLDSDVINAFSLPGGKVFFSRGLAAKLENEAQLAAVLGHEIGHVTARHINDQIFRQTMAEGAGSLASSLLEGRGGVVGELSPQLIQLGQQSVLLRFSRKQELQADELGMRYMTKAGYDPIGMRGVMEVLDKAMAGNTTPEFFSTHPYPETRIKAIDDRMKSVYANAKGTLNAAPYQQRMIKALGKRAMAPAAQPASLASLGDPVVWCEHCRQESALAAADR